MTDIPYSKETTVKVGDIEIVYDTFGNPSSLPLLLIMGLGSQMILGGGLLQGTGLPRLLGHSF